MLWLPCTPQMPGGPCLPCMPETRAFPLPHSLPRTRATFSAPRALTPPTSQPLPSPRPKLPPSPSPRPSWTMGQACRHTMRPQWPACLAAPRQQTARKAPTMAAPATFGLPSTPRQQIRRFPPPSTLARPPTRARQPPSCDTGFRVDSPARRRPSFAPSTTPTPGKRPTPLGSLQTAPGIRRLLTFPGGRRRARCAWTCLCRPRCPPLATGTFPTLERASEAAERARSSVIRAMSALARQRQATHSPSRATLAPPPTCKR